MSLISMQSALGLIVVVLSMLGFFYVLNRYKGRFLSSQTGNLAIESQIPLGLRQRLVLVKAREKTFLLVISNDNATVVHSWDD
jgi:flagellar biogenesis protein FliO